VKKPARLGATSLMSHMTAIAITSQTLLAAAHRQNSTHILTSAILVAEKSTAL
jgi:hypothetical protein